MRHGYQHVSIDGIARASGVSKETIYRHFNDKQDLFRAAMKNVSDKFAHDFSKILHGDACPEEVLIRCARAIYDVMADTEHPTPNWLAIGTVKNFPELARVVFSDTIESLTPLRLYLERLAREHGTPKEITFDVLAQFGALATAGPLHIMGGTPPADVDQTIRRAVALFLHGCGRNLDDKAGVHQPAHTFSLDPMEVSAAPEEHIATLLSVARSHFYEAGYRSASLNEIGTIAGVGRGTIYRHFKNKEGLFRAVMQRCADDVIARGTLMVSTERPVRENLLHMAEAINDILQEADAITLYRTVCAETKAMPDVGQDIYARTRGRLIPPVARYLAWCTSQSLLKVEDVDWAADQFVTLATGGNRYLLSETPPDANERSHTARMAVSTFLDGFWGRDFQKA